MSDETEDRGSLFAGLSRRDERVLRLVVRDEVRGALKEVVDGDCIRACPRVESIETVVFGRSETGVVGLDERVRTIESYVADQKRLLWLVRGALVTAGVSIVLALAALAPGLFN